MKMIEESLSLYPGLIGVQRLSGPTIFLQFSMACRNLCDRLYSKIIFGKSHHEGDKKYCSRCEVYYCHDSVFCSCCGMALRMSPTNKRYNERRKRRVYNYIDLGSCIWVGKS